MYINNYFYIDYDKMRKIISKSHGKKTKKPKFSRFAGPFFHVVFWNS